MKPESASASVAALDMLIPVAQKTADQAPMVLQVAFARILLMLKKQRAAEYEAEQLCMGVKP